MTIHRQCSIQRMWSLNSGQVICTSDKYFLVVITLLVFRNSKSNCIKFNTDATEHFIRQIVIKTCKDTTDIDATNIPPWPFDACEVRDAEPGWAEEHALVWPFQAASDWQLPARSDSGELLKEEALLLHQADGNVQRASAGQLCCVSSPQRGCFQRVSKFCIPRSAQDWDAGCQAGLVSVEPRHV